MVTRDGARRNAARQASEPAATGPMLLGKPRILDPPKGGVYAALAVGHLEPRRWRRSPRLRKRRADLKLERCVLWSATAAARNGHERDVVLNAARRLQRLLAPRVGARNLVGARSAMAHLPVVSDVPQEQTGEVEVGAAVAVAC